MSSPTADEILRSAGYQSIVMFVFVIQLAIMIAAIVLMNGSDGIKDSKTKTDVNGMLIFCIIWTFLFTSFLITGFVRGGTAYYSITPACYMNQSNSLSSVATPQSTTKQAIILLAFVVSTVCLIVVAAMGIPDIKDDKTKTDVTGLLSFSITWNFLFTAMMGWSFYNESVIFKYFNPYCKTLLPLLTVQ